MILLTAEMSVLLMMCSTNIEGYVFYMCDRYVRYVHHSTIDSHFKDECMLLDSLIVPVSAAYMVTENTSDPTRRCLDF